MMHKSLCIILLISVSILLLIYNTKRNHLVEQLNGIRADSHGDKFSAIFNHLKTKITDSDNPRDFVLFGDFLFRYGYAEEGCILYQKSIEIDPAQYQANIGIAVCLDELGYINEAIGYYQEANKFAEDSYQITENTQRIGELHLRLGNIDKALSIFESLHYAPAIVKRCRIYIYKNLFNKAQRAFELLLTADSNNDALEVDQLNALSYRHFGKHFANLVPNRRRELLFSEHIPMRMRKSLAEHSFGLYINDLYGSQIRLLPVASSDTQIYTDNDILNASKDLDQISAGKHIYVNSGCVICHGSDGSGIIGPNLLDNYWIGENISPSKVFSIILHGQNSNKMPSFKNILDSTQIRDVSAYVLSIHRNAQTNKSSNGKEPQGTKQMLTEPSN